MLLFSFSENANQGKPKTTTSYQTKTPTSQPHLPTIQNPRILSILDQLFLSTKKKRYFNPPNHTLPPKPPARSNPIAYSQARPHRPPQRLQTPQSPLTLPLPLNLTLILPNRVPKLQPLQIRADTPSQPLGHLLVLLLQIVPHLDIKLLKQVYILPFWL